MSQTNINRVILTGNLTADPELRETSTGLTVCKLRVASSTRRKTGDGEGYEDRPNYFNVTVWGTQGETAADHLSKGRPVAIDGRLEWREWETADGERRQGIDIVADSLQFLGAPTGSSETSDDTQLAPHPDQSRPTSRRPVRGKTPQRRYSRPRTTVAA
jgi:single-strand DNA-binding protein